ncbi:potassium transporter [Lysinibacillus sp. BW-2-10]|uniref:potassium transporter n=1 Tax=Lysinibacillus sp. BW-2-10 TaxID=2590030 RepID=UPI00117E6E9C|nr:potassium transporter [Lysinibacillus sp. BW-2-10]TSI10126.1 potassium transporter [Lysinibacillus sp. BW-2-10]
MKLFSGSKNSSLILLVALVAALLFALYYYVVLPKKDEASLTQTSISSLQTEITTLQDQINNLQSEQVIESNTFALRKKLPQSREIDQLLLNIEEIEYISGTRVLNINFNNYDSLVSETLPEEEATEETTEQPAPAPEENANTEETPETEEIPMTSIDRASIPNDLKLITFTIDVEAPNARNLQKFIEEVENLERIMHVDTISFALPGEESVILDEDEVVSVSLQVTTFYYEGE